MNHAVVCDLNPVVVEIRELLQSLDLADLEFLAGVQGEGVVIG